MDWKKRKESLSYIFKQELDKVTAADFKVKDGQHPNLIQLYMQGEIGLDTLIIICECTKIVPIWNKKIEDTIMWPEIRKKCSNYSKFMHYDKQKFCKLCVDYFRGM